MLFLRPTGGRGGRYMVKLTLIDKVNERLLEYPSI